MTLSTIPNLTVERAVEYIAKYREDHRIFPTAVFGGRGLVVCSHDGITLRKVKGGWRHEASLVAELSREAGPVPVGRCRSCKRTFAAHIRLAALHDILVQSGNPAVTFTGFKDDANDAGLIDAPLGGYQLHDFVE